MPRKPSPETEIRVLRRELKEARATATRNRWEYVDAKAKLTEAVRELAEWKARFDKLLALGLREHSGEEPR